MLFRSVGKLLPARQHRERVVVIVEMGKLALAVGAGNDTDTAALRPRGRQRHPGGDVLERCQSEIGRVLVPGNVVLAAGRLQSDRRVKHQNIRPDYGFHQVQDAGMAHQLGRPGKNRYGFTRFEAWRFRLYGL